MGDTQFKPKSFKRDRAWFFHKFFCGKPKKRVLDCFQCGKNFEVIRDAQSSQCPKCSGYINLKDYKVDDDWRRRIQTRGDVTILKTGSIIGVHVECHDLTVFGKLAASVDCSGVLCIMSHSKITGNVKCRELKVKRGAEVEFLGEVHAAKTFINGNVNAQITCTGTLTLGKKARLQGGARAGGFIVKTGAKLLGAMEIVSTTAAEAKSL